VSCSQHSGGSNFSFNSDKLIDGYKEFVVLNKKRQLEMTIEKAA
jgi:hypothetical protein